MRITIIGAGAFGTALSKILLQNGHELAFYDPAVNPSYSFRDACDFAETFVFSAPSHVLSDTVKKIPVKYYKKPFICASKGLLSMDPFRSLENVQILSGPAFAADLIHKKPTTLTATSVSVSRLFDADFITFEICHDKLGVLLCGTLKNIYAIYAGLCGIRPATADYQDYLLQSMREFQTILRLNHARPSTAQLSCGFRDLALTSSSAHSRNYTFGKNIRAGNSIDSSETIEGLTALRLMAKMRKSGTFTLPDDLEHDLPILSIILQYTEDYL